VSRRVGALITAFLVGLIILVASFRRIGLGVAGSRSESMFVDLRDRIARQSRIPTLPADWFSSMVLRSAGGSKFAGDFVVAAESPDRSWLQIVLVDVSGKGEQAGTRSLLLSGAFGALLGALPVERFLPAANEYLLAQDWSEGFATAVHLAIDLRSGAFELRSAGHPPAVQLNAGSGRWTAMEVEGPVLGLMEGAEFAVERGTLQRGDAVMLYTDGVVETPSRDISLGIDRLVGEAERLFRTGFEAGASRLIGRLSLADDDQALLVLHRR
ncbi:MAG: PP2C family protein-serine/threonine phosphatase, partial [Nocardioidaceae bacterium]